MFYNIVGRSLPEHTLDPFNKDTLDLLVAEHNANVLLAVTIIIMLSYHIVLCGVYARISKISHTEGKYATCRRLHILPGQTCLHLIIAGPNVVICRVRRGTK